MKRHLNLRWLACAMLMTIACSASALKAYAQDDVNSYKVGERIEYKDKNDYDSATNSYPVRWLTGTVVRVIPESNQVVVRWDPRTGLYSSYTHNGVSNYEQGYKLDEVRHIKAHTNDKPAANNGGTANASGKENNGGNKERADAPKEAAYVGGTGLMSKAEILGYMRSHGYVNGQPKKDIQVCKDLIEQMKRRGVKELFAPAASGGTDNLSPLYDNGCNLFDYDVESAVVNNLGTPPTLAWLTGTWMMYVIGGTVDTAPGDGYIHRKNESIGNTGFLTINGDGTYVWKVNTGNPAKYVKGTYRMATPKEMGLYGGVGIVLQKADEGIDWIVFKYQSRVPNKTERIEVEDIVYRGSHRHIGWRK